VILRGGAVILLMVILSACAAIDVNMGPYYVAPRSDCPVEVADRTATPDLIQGNAYAYRISPAIRELLRSKLCRSEPVLSAAAGGKPAVTITGLTISSYGFAGSDEMLTMTGSVRLQGADRHVQSYGTVESGVLPSTRWHIILNSALDNFVKQVEETAAGRR